MKAVLLVRRRVVLATNTFVEIVILQVPRPVPPSIHPFKYRLAYIVNGKCVLRYDNERGKGAHRHIGSEEWPYPFSTPERLMANFNADIKRWNDEHRDSGCEITG